MVRVANAFIDLTNTIREANRLPSLKEKPVMVNRSSQANFAPAYRGSSKSTQTEEKRKKETSPEKRKPQSTSSDETRKNQLMNDLATTSDEDVCTYEEQQLKLLEKEVNRRRINSEYVPQRVHYPPRSSEPRSRRPMIHPYRPSSTITRPASSQGKEKSLK